MYLELNIYDLVLKIYIGGPLSISRQNRPKTHLSPPFLIFFKHFKVKKQNVNESLRQKRYFCPPILRFRLTRLDMT